MELPKLMLIVNPRSGVKEKAGIADTLAQKLGDMGYDTDLRFTEHAGHATDLAAEAVGKRYDSVLVCGGDGTVNEAARALCGSDVAFGIVPSGSGNGLARHVGIPVDELMSLDIIAKRHLLDCDCGIVNGTPFFCTFGMGFDAHVSHRFAQAGRRGKLTYVKSAIEEFRTYGNEHYVIDIDGQALERDAFLVTCCNASQYGNNAFIAPEASITDGLLDIVIIKSSHALQTLLAGFDVIAGNVPHNHHIEVIKARKVRISHPGLTLAHIDGEPTTVTDCADVECLPGKLKMYVNPDKKRFTPFVTPIELAMRDLGIDIAKLFRKIGTVALFSLQ